MWLEAYSGAAWESVTLAEDPLQYRSLGNARLSRRRSTGSAARHAAMTSVMVFAVAESTNHLFMSLMLVQLVICSRM